MDIDEPTRHNDEHRAPPDWLDVLDGVRDALGRAASDLGGLAEDAADLWDTLEDGIVDLGSTLEDVGREISDWPSRVARLTSSAWVLAQITTSYRFQDAVSGFRSPDGATNTLQALHARNARRFYQAAVRLGEACEGAPSDSTAEGHADTR